MNKFYFVLWFRWATRLFLCSIALSIIFSSLITLYIYFKQGTPALDSQILNALLEIAIFWFLIIWNLSILVALFRSLKYLFNRCIYGYELKLYSCDLKDIITDVGYGDLLKVWRKWFMLLIWLVSSLMILALAYTYLFTEYDGVFEWFSIYWLFSFILFGGYFSFIFMSARCKRIEVVQC